MDKQELRSAFLASSTIRISGVRPNIGKATKTLSGKTKTLDPKNDLSKARAVRTPLGRKGRTKSFRTNTRARELLMEHWSDEIVDIADDTGWL